MDFCFFAASDKGSLELVQHLSQWEDIQNVMPSQPHDGYSIRRYVYYGLRLKYYAQIVATVIRIL